MDRWKVKSQQPAGRGRGVEVDRHAEMLLLHIKQILIVPDRVRRHLLSAATEQECPLEIAQREDGGVALVRLRTKLRQTRPA